MQPTPNETQLILRAQQSDEEAAGLLYEMHVESIFTYISYRVDSSAMAEDLTAEVFLRMVRSLQTYRVKGAPFRAWLYRIAANLITDHYRQHQKVVTVPMADDYRNDDTDPFDRMAKQERHLQLRKAIKRLSEDYQTLLILRFVEELPHPEIAKIMNKSAMALRAMQHRALKALAIELEAISKTQKTLPEEK
jgi:RNA polymerase sigma factor (sigma-70 family)